MQGTRRPLTERQERFVEEYCISLNASAAARKAGYSQKSAHRFCLELLTKPHIQDALKKKRHELSQQSHISALRVLQEFVSIGMSDIAEVVEQKDSEDGKVRTLTIRDLNKLPKHIRACVASVEQTEEVTPRSRRTKTKVTLWPKQPALDSIVKMLAYDRAAVDKELAAQANAGQAEQNVIDPRKLDREGWEAFKVLNKKRMEQLSP